MHPDMENPLVIGGGFSGGFDSLVIGGIFEDDDDRFEVSEAVRWLDAKGDPIREGRTYIHFRNRGLDPREHGKPVELVFDLLQAEGPGPRRVVHVDLSGETFVRRPAE
jgi:hypothetical protein